MTDKELAEIFDEINEIDAKEYEAYWQDKERKQSIEEVET